MATSETFFYRYPLLKATSKTDVRGERLVYRYRALIKPNRKAIRGKRVLDLASHDGRWSLAALDLGASHVTGIEGRPELVKKAESTLAAYHIGGDRYRFIVGDCLNQMADFSPGTFDTVFCFGFLYHTLNHYDLLRTITKLEPATLLIDSRVVPIEEPAIFLAFNDPNLEGAAISHTDSEKTVLVGVPTVPALLLMLQHLGWESVVQPPPTPETPDEDGIRDYCRGRRVCIIATRAAAKRE